MYTCPHCNQRSISVIRRASIGPAQPKACPACGKLVGIPWSKGLVALSPLVLSAIAAMYFVQTPLVGMAALLLVGIVATMGLLFTYVPLEPR